MNVSILAKQMNVTENDVTSLLNMVTTSLQQDDMVKQFIGMNEDERTMVIQAYARAEVKKFTDFCIALHTNTEKRSAFTQYTLTKL
jgi:hypothetical protein